MVQSKDKEKKEGFVVKCKDTTINSTTEVKYLGIKIDETLSGSGIQDTVLKKCNGRKNTYTDKLDASLQD